MNIYPAYISEHNLNHENQIFLLMIPNGERWHYLAVKKLSALLKGITWKYKGDFYCLNNCLILLEQKKNLNLIKDLWNKDFCGDVIASKDTKMLEFSNKNLIRYHLLFIQISILWLKKLMDGKIILKN